jgi:hypothetical protein
MIAIGFRVSPSQVAYAIVRAAPPDFSVIDVSAVLVPLALSPPRQLQFVRTALLDVMEEYGTTRAGLRLAEATAQRTHAFRHNLEGIIQELMTNSSVERFITARIATIAALIGEKDRTVIKRLVSGELSPAYSANWGGLSEEEREAVLVAVAAASAGAQPVTVVEGEA